MKNLLIVVLIMLPALSFAQLDNDGKTFVKVSEKQSNSAKPHTIMFSGAASEDGFLPGIKYQYCNTLGGYANFRSSFGGWDWNNSLLTVGLVKSLGDNFKLYAGGGIDFVSGYDYDGSYYYEEEESYIVGIIEGGFVLKFNWISIDLGGGIAPDGLGGFFTVGFGFNF